MTRKKKTVYVGNFPGRHTFYHAARDRSSYILPNGMYSNQARGCLKKCWIGFRIAKAHEDRQNMVYYASGIQKFARQLGLEIPSFPDLNMLGLGEPDDNAEHMYDERMGYENDLAELVSDEHEESDSKEDPYGLEVTKKHKSKYFKSLNM